MKKITPFLIALLLLCFAPTMQSQVVINEVLSSNSTVLADENGSYEDWVELFNTGATTVNLNGYGLSDDAALPLKWTFPNVSIGAGQYLIVWCSDKNRRVPGSPLHTNFKITSDGEAVILSSPAGVLVNNSPAIGSLQNISIGRSPNGTGNFLFFGIPTPNAANTTASYSEELAPPVFSQNSGFVTAGFSLSISTDVPGASIIYTLDGSEPKLSNLGGTTYSYKNQYPEVVSTNIKDLQTTVFDLLPPTGSIEIQFDSPNRVHEQHSHPVDETLHIIQGEITMEYGGIETTCIAGDRLLLPAKTIHRSKAGKDGCLYVIASRIIRPKSIQESNENA
jgi:mannose-6-phosphate isomerase-like protein (cupin superfamily)